MLGGRRPAALAVAAALLLGGLTTTPNSIAAEPGDAPRVLVIGDSISAKSYYNRAVNGKGWWSYLAEDTGARLIMSVENGSGIVRRGEHCAGTTFGDRLATLDLSRADYVVVEGGMNDLYYCTGRGYTAWSKGHRLRRHVRAFMAQLAAAADLAGLPRDHIYVFTPWGTERLPQRPRLRKIIRANTTQIGATYVDVPAFSARQTKDGIHPTRKGSRFLYRKLARGSDLVSSINAR